MKVVLIHPPHYDCTDDRLDPPMGLLYIAAHLQQHEIDVSVIDLSGFDNEFNIPYADVYGMTVYVSSLQISRDIALQCRKINPRSILVVGGVHPSSCPNEFSYANYVVRGYGETAMLDIVQGKRLEHIIIGSESIDPFIFPAYNLIDISSYHRIIENKPSLPYITSRGCPFHCYFCGLATMHHLGVNVRMMTPIAVYEQIKRMKDEFGIERINFQDDIFTFDPDRLFTLLDLIAPLNIKFRCMGRAGYDTERVYEKLAEAGCVQVAWGIESGSQYILNRMGKNVKVYDNYNVIQWAKKYGIVSRAFFIIGFPGETKETLADTMKFIQDADPDQYFASNFIPYPGTEVNKKPIKFGITNISTDYRQYYQVSGNGTGGITIDTKWLTKEDFRALEISFREWLNNRPMRGSLQEYEK